MPLPLPTYWRSLYLCHPFSFRQVFPTKPFIHFSPLLLQKCYIPRCCIILDLIIRMISGEDYRSSSFSPRSLFHSSVTSPLLGPNILLSILFTNTFSRCSYFNVRYQVSHMQKNRQNCSIVSYY
jgi:hypothetical protein